LIFSLTVACLGLGVYCGSATAAPAPAWAPVAGTGPTVLPRQENEIQAVVVRAESGTFTLSFNGQTTAALPFEAAATEVQTALNALSSIGGSGGSVAVESGRGGPSGQESPYVVVFGGSLAGSNQPQISGDGSALVGPGAGVIISTTVEGGLGTSTMAIFAQNVGGAASSGPITLTGTMPDGVRLDGPAQTGFPNWTCSNAPDEKSFTCTYTGTVPGGETLETPLHPIQAEPAAPGRVTVSIEVSGGGAARPASFEMPLTIGEGIAEPGFQSFTAGAYDEEGNRDSRAGGHPYSASTGILVNTTRSPLGNIVPVGEFKDINVSLPPGFLGNPTAIPACPASLVDSGGQEPFSLTKCPLDSIVGTAQPGLGFGSGNLARLTPVVNLEPPPGYPAAFRFKTLTELIHVNARLRSDGDYGIDVESANTPQIASVFYVFFTFWGTPGAAVHDSLRCGFSGCGSSDAGETAFLTNPTNCAEEAAAAPVTKLTTNTWEHPSFYSSEDVVLPPVTGCANLKFVGTSTFRSSVSNADSPASFESNITVPPEGLTDPTKLAVPDLRRTVVQLPKGVTLNPSAADGLASCSLQQIGYLGGDFSMPNPMRFSKDPNQCPDSSKIGIVTLTTPLLNSPLNGTLYLADQGAGNPFGSVFAIYLVVEDPRTGIVIKLPGEVEPDQGSGQLTATFDNLPQLPFSGLNLKLKGGDRSALANPETCGSYVTNTTFTPWSAPESGPPTSVADTMEINQGPNGGSCAATPEQRPFGLGLEAGSATPVAGAHSPFTIRVTRPDGAQEVGSLDIKTPLGFTATLKGVPYCSEAQIAAARQGTGREEQANPSCPAASQVGTTSVGAGAGPKPFYTPGKLYLAGPYKGAPLSVVAITPAVAGPLDLGDVVIRSAVYVDPETAQITAKTDPLPEFLEGVQLRIRDIRINLDRHDWTLNPTSCEPKTVEVTAHGNSGGAANLSSHFQVGNCRALAFKPKLTLSLKGGTKRADNPALTATLTQKPGQTNIRQVAVTLPHSEFLEQGHIGTVCTRVQFSAVPRACPAKSIYGYAEAESPLLDYKLAGPVYLRSSDHKLPDLVVALQGPASQPIEIDLDGRIDSKHGGIRNSFELVPDAPVSKFVLRMQGGKKGLLVNSTNLCTAKAKARRATVRIVGHNGKQADQSPLLTNQCGKPKKVHHKKQRNHGRHKRADKSSLLRHLGVGW
jgi:hypothetical protein